MAMQYIDKPKESKQQIQKIYGTSKEANNNSAYYDDNHQQH